MASAPPQGWGNQQDPPPPGYMYDAFGNLVPAPDNLGGTGLPPTNPTYYQPGQGPANLGSPAYQGPEVRIGDDPNNPGGSIWGGSPTPNPNTPPPPGGNNGGGNTGGNAGGGYGGPAPTPFNWPTYTPPAYTPQQPWDAPAGYVPTQFSYADFVLPTLDQAKNQPGYQFGLQQGQDALQNSAAARGTLRSGGSLKDLFNWTNAAGEQNYGNVVNQNLGAYNTNRANAYGNWAANETARAGAYGVNLGTMHDVYNSGVNANQSNFNNATQNARDVFNPQFDIAKLSFSDLYNRWKTAVDATTNIATAGAS